MNRAKGRKSNKVEKAVRKVVQEKPATVEQQKEPEAPAPAAAAEVDKSKSETLKGPVVIGGRLCLSPYDLVRYELCRFKLMALKQSRELAQHEVARFERQLQLELQTKKAEEAQAARLLAAHEEEFEGLRKEIGALYNLNMDDLSYDMHSGRIKIKGRDISV
jgi:hypothetical protein